MHDHCCSSPPSLLCRLRLDGQGGPREPRLRLAVPKGVRRCLDGHDGERACTSHTSHGADAVSTHHPQTRSPLSLSTMDRACCCLCCCCCCCNGPRPCGRAGGRGALYQRNADTALSPRSMSSSHGCLMVASTQCTVECARPVRSSPPSCSQCDPLTDCPADPPCLCLCLFSAPRLPTSTTSTTRRRLRR